MGVPLEIVGEDEEFDWESAVREIDLACLKTSNASSSTNFASSNLDGVPLRTESNRPAKRQSILDRFIGRTENKSPSPEIKLFLMNLSVVRRIVVPVLVLILRQLKLGFIQLTRFHRRDKRVGWTRQKLLHLMIGSSNTATCRRWHHWSNSFGFLLMGAIGAKQVVTSRMAIIAASVIFGSTKIVEIYHSKSIILLPLKLFPVSRNTEYLCKVCREKVVVELAYRCFECKVIIHVECVNSKEVNHPSHTKHPLKLLTSGAPDYTDKTCLLCGWKLEVVLYHCSMCNFSLCLSCAIIPPPLDVEHLKTHEHKLTLMARQISFICDACGIQGNHSPYFCLQCDFMIHRSCIGLPRVININRHDHRITHTQQLGLGDWRCRICLQSVNGFYGAFCCSICIDYVVHSQCATRNDVWDGLELEGIPEETEDIITPFKEIGVDLINHFSHEEHNLKLNKDGFSHWPRSATGHGENIRCEGCMLPVYFDPVYSCDQCEFILHAPIFLGRNDTCFTTKSPKVLPCGACGEFFNGFRYASDDVVLDVGCISISDFFSTENHPHPLHYNKTYTGKCDACHGWIEAGGFSCESCDFNLDFRILSLYLVKKT